MNEQIHRRIDPHWQVIIEVLTFFLSLVAIIISIYTLTFQRRLGHEISTQTLIHDQYELCRVLDLERVEHPEVSHMLALPAQNGDIWKHYRTFKTQVRHLIEAQGPITEGCPFSSLLGRARDGSACL